MKEEPTQSENSQPHAPPGLATVQGGKGETSFTIGNFRCSLGYAQQESHDWDVKNRRIILNIPNEKGRIQSECELSGIKWRNQPPVSPPSFNQQGDLDGHRPKIPLSDMAPNPGGMCGFIFEMAKIGRGNSRGGDTAPHSL